MAQQISVLGIDIAKLVFHVVGMDERGQVVLRQGSALHVMLFLENILQVLFIFNGLRRRHCQRALLGYHYQTVFLTNALVQQPWRPFDDDDDRSLIENCCIKDTKQQWNLGHPPQKTERAVRVHVMFTLLMFALATAYRLLCAQEATGGDPVGWQCWWRQLLQQTRDQVIVCAQGYDGIFHIAEYSLLLGVRLKDTPPGLGTCQDILAKYRLTTRS